MLTPNFSPLTSKWLSRSLLAAILSTMSCFTGLTPSISLKGAAILDFNSAASAQQSAPSLSAAEITNYAKALLEIEPLRQDYYNKIKQGLTGRQQMPQIICSDQNSVNNLPRNIRQSAIAYCESSIEIVEKNGLTIQRFNDITNLLTQDTRILERITAELLRLQTTNLFQ
jgi:Domain of unknown function (DUF4168)